METVRACECFVVLLGDRLRHLQDLFGSGIVLGQLMGAIGPGAVRLPALPRPCGNTYLTWDVAPMIGLAQHFEQRVRAAPSRLTSCTRSAACQVCFALQRGQLGVLISRVLRRCSMLQLRGGDAQSARRPWEEQFC